MWERLAGDTSTFAVKLSFAEDPHRGAGVHPEVAPTWGSFQLWVDGVNVSAHLDSGETLQSTHWYLLPFLEWLADNWDPLFHEERLPPTADAGDAAQVAPPWSELVGFDHAVAMHVEHDYEWRRRHGLRSARDGGVFPGVFFRRMRQHLEISWEDSPVAGAGDVRHVAPNGRSLQHPELVANALHTVATEATSWLASRTPESSRVAALSEALSSIADQGSDARIAWLSGLGPTKDVVLARWEEVRALVSERVSEAESALSPVGDTAGLVVSGSPTASLLFGSASPTIGEEDVVALVELAVNRAVADRVDLDKLRQDQAPSSLDREIWNEGYQLAIDVLDSLEVGQSIVEMDDLLEELGVALHSVALSDDRMRAVSLADDTHEPVIGVNASNSFNSTPGGRRFTLAHELCYLLHDRSYGVQLAIASGPGAPRVLEQRANAFAAMFLMPPDMMSQVVKELDVPINTPEGSREAARRLEVSHSAFVSHATNLGWMTPEDRQLLVGGS